MLKNKKYFKGNDEIINTYQFVKKYVDFLAESVI